MAPVNVQSAFLWRQSAIRVLRAELALLEEDLHDIVDRIRASKQIMH